MFRYFDSFFQSNFDNLFQSNMNKKNVGLFGSKCAALVPARRPVREFYVLSLFLSVWQMTAKQCCKSTDCKGFNNAVRART